MIKIRRVSTKGDLTDNNEENNNNEPPKNLCEVIESNEQLPISYITDYEEFLNQAKINFQKRLHNGNKSLFHINYFELIRTIGVGSFGRVVLAKFKNTSKMFAIKILPKEKIVFKKQVQHLINERNILKSIQFPFIVTLEDYFQDSTYVYFVLPYLSGGELFYHLRNNGKLSELSSRYYAGQICLGLEFLHYLNIVYRDLKPENLVLDYNGDLKFVDFGFARLVESRAWSLCGTPEYIAPEMLANRGYSFSVDVWSFGILLYEMHCGKTPFKSESIFAIYEKILKGYYNIPSKFSQELKDLIKQILVVSVPKRICGSDQSKEPIKKHKWFKGLEWEALLNGTLKPPFSPDIRTEVNPMNFEKFRESEIIINLDDNYDEYFVDF